jgi:hypothetical protein
MMGVDVVCVDEFEGPVICDLGDLLYEYAETCVERPEVSLERYDPEFEGVPFFHEVASMLGIFGNLMTCTFAHASIILPLPPDPSFSSYNCAGDDGLKPETLETEAILDRGIQIVGSYERSKSFRGDEEGAIHLKRPFEDTRPSPNCLLNIVPPSVATVILLLSDIVDPRYVRFGDESLYDSISLIGRDMMRFLRSAYRLGFKDSYRLGLVVQGFEYLIKRLSGVTVRPGVPRSFDPQSYLWPINPSHYEFSDIDPLRFLLMTRACNTRFVPRWEVMVDESLNWRYEGDVFEGNSTRRLKLLEMLGYVRKDEVMRELKSDDEVLAYWFWKFDDGRSFVPSVYSYTNIRDIPDKFLYTE